MKTALLAIFSLSCAAFGMGDGFEIDSGGVGIAPNAAHADHWRFIGKPRLDVATGAFQSHATANFHRELISMPVDAKGSLTVWPGAATADIRGTLTLAPVIKVYNAPGSFVANLTVDAGPLVDKLAAPLKQAEDRITAAWETLLFKVEVAGGVVIVVILASWAIHVKLIKLRANRGAY